MTTPTPFCPVRDHLAALRTHYFVAGREPASDWLVDLGDVLDHPRIRLEDRARVVSRLLAAALADKKLPADLRLRLTACKRTQLLLGRAK